MFDAPVHVPRRQTLDFHPELFPPVPNTVPALAGSAWLEGAQALLSLVQIGPQGPQYASSSSASVSAPATTGSAEQQVSASAREKPEHAISRPDESVEKPAETQSQKAVQHDIVRPGASQSSDTIKSAAPSKSTRSEPVLSSAPSKPAPTNSPIPSASAPAPASTGTPKSTTSGAAPSAHWSRSFLIGKTPLKPAYEGLSGLSTTAPPEQPMLRCNPRFLVFPLGGAGGRLAVHPTRQTGRLPSVMPGLVCGATITSFELDPFDHTRVYVACDDAKIRLFGMPEEGLKEDTGGHERLLQGRSQPLADSLLSGLRRTSHTSSALALPTFPGQMLAWTESLKYDATLRLRTSFCRCRMTEETQPSGSGIFRQVKWNCPSLSRASV